MADCTGMGITLDPTKLLNALRALNKVLSASADIADAPELGARETNMLLDEIWSAKELLDAVAQEIDPFRQPSFVLDPTDPKTVGMMIGRLLEELPAVGFEELGQFYGSGVYAIYYQGEFPAYQAIGGTLCPIYVGKADPASAKARTPKEQGPRLCARLHEHAKSIRTAQNLRLKDFYCRYLVTQSGWQRAAEEYLINRYNPVWNGECCSGMGKHGDKARTERSDWDILHPGRTWADGQTSRAGSTPGKIAAAIEGHFVKLCQAEPSRWESLLNEDWVKAQAKH